MLLSVIPYYYQKLYTSSILPEGIYTVWARRWLRLTPVSVVVTYGFLEIAPSLVFVLNVNLLIGIGLENELS
jgi:hypothetical protein